MPNLHQTLRQTDLDFLQRIARQWGIDLSAKAFSPALEEIEIKLCDEALFKEILEALPEEGRKAWRFLLDHEGRADWSLFTRQFGELRAMGLAKREREAPDETPVSAVESLWYKGLIGRAFLDLSGETKEYAYVPDEFFALVKPEQVNNPDLLPRPATEAETRFPRKGNDHILEDVTDLLADLRMGRVSSNDQTAYQQSYSQFLLAALNAAGLLTSDQQPDPQRLKEFLSAPRSEALLSLFNAWSASTTLNDLRMLPGLIFEGNWSNDPLLPRKIMLDLLQRLAADTWWSIASLLAKIKEHQPDFQRSAGDYDSWFIRDAKTNAHLQGSKNWDKVEGALLRYLIAGPLHWLGVLDLGFSEKNGRPTAFKVSALGTALLAGTAPKLNDAEEGLITITGTNIFTVPISAARTLRYQLARFGRPIKKTAGETSYQISPASLQEAAAQGLLASHLIQLLQQTKGKTLPPALLQQLERWEKYGAEAVFSQSTLLRLSRPEILPLLQKNPRAMRCIEEVLNPKVILIKAGSQETLQKILAELGFLC